MARARTRLDRRLDLRTSSRAAATVQAIFLNAWRLCRVRHAAADRRSGSTRSQSFGWSLMREPLARDLPLSCRRALRASYSTSITGLRCGSIVDGAEPRTCSTTASAAVLQKTEEQFLWTLRYVVRNARRGGPVLVRPFDARWSSFAATACSPQLPTTLACRGDPRALRAGSGRGLGERFVEFVVGATSDYAVETLSNPHCSKLRAQPAIALSTPLADARRGVVSVRIWHRICAVTKIGV